MIGHTFGVRTVILAAALVCCWVGLAAAAQFAEIVTPTRFPGATGLGWGDYDNDGYADLFIAGTDQGTPLGGIHGPLLYHNNGDGTFTEVGAALGLPQEVLRQEAAKWADTNADGYLDIIVPAADRAPYYYFLLDDGTRFAEGSEYTGMPLAGPSRDAAWGDHKYPGYVDLFVPTQGEDSCLFVNLGYGYFDEEHVLAGIHTHEDPDIDAMSGAWGDYDGDGWADLLIARARGPAMLYHNDSGDGTFLDVSASSGLDLAFDTYSAIWGDYDNDGWLDCYLTTSSLTTPTSRRDYLFHNNQDGTFSEVGTTAGMAGDLAIGYAATWVDYNNDGWLDLYVGNWNTSGATPSFLYRNNGDGTFTDVMAGSGLEGSFQNTAAGWADYDLDGKLDLAQATADGYTRLFHNTGPAGNWLRVRATRQALPCVLADPYAFPIGLHDAIGTRVAVNLDNDPAFPPGPTLTRVVDGSNSLGGQNEAITHFGLGTSSLVAVRVTFPNAHTIIRTDIAANQQLAIDELLQYTGCVTGHVYDAATGDPIAGAGVEVVDGPGRGTDDTGFYAIGGIDQGVVTVQASASGYRLVAVTGVTVVAEAEVHVDFQLEHTAGSIGGVVRDAVTHQPIAGASIWCTGDREATTGVDGAYLLAGLPVGGDYVITAWAPGYDGTNLYPIAVVDQQTTEVNVDLVPLPGRIVGRVTDARAGAAPVVGATVACGDHTATTDVNGGYALDDVPAGPGQTLTVTALGFVDATVSGLSVPSQQDLMVDVVLVPVFADILPDDWALAAIIACADAGIVTGYGDGNYHSDWVVTRGQMAVFLARAQAGSDEAVQVPPGVLEPSFWDVPDSGYGDDGADPHWAYRYVEYIHGNGTVEGYWDGAYRPDREVTRGQMAVFLARALVAPFGEAGVPPPTVTEPTFSDVTPDGDCAWCYRHVEYLAARGVVNGYWDGTYRPDETVTRAQMAVFVARAFELL